MATTTEHFYTGNGSSTDYSFTFSYLHTDHIKVTLDTVATTAFTLPNTTTVRFDTAPGSGVDIHIYRETDVCVALATFVPGSSIRSVDLNDNFDRALYALQEHQDQLVKTDDIKDGAVTSAKILDGTILDVDINASAAIQGTKISPDFGSQAVSTTGTVSTGALGVTGNITVSGTVDGRDVAADGTKLDGIESGATADQTNAEIRAAVEAATESKVLTDADHTIIKGIETTSDKTSIERTLELDIFEDELTEFLRSKKILVRSTATANRYDEDEMEEQLMERLRDSSKLREYLGVDGYTFDNQYSGCTSGIPDIVALDGLNVEQVFELKKEGGPDIPSAHFQGMSYCKELEKKNLIIVAQDYEIASDVEIKVNIWNNKGWNIRYEQYQTLVSDSTFPNDK